MMRALPVSILMVAVLLAGIPLTAYADGAKVIIKRGPFVHHKGHARFVHGHPHRAFSALHPSPHAGFFVPRTVIVVPSRRWVPGYWSYQWVPQIYTGYVWVPGHWSPAGTWIEGHYETRAVTSGYYQPVWVNGYWVD